MNRFAFVDAILNCMNCLVSYDEFFQAAFLVTKTTFAKFPINFSFIKLQQNDSRDFF